MKTRRAAIAGAGFAGLAAGIALAQRGWSVELHERSPNLRAEGYGIAIHENGQRVLQALGVADRCRATAMRVDRLISTDSRGQVVAEIPVVGDTYRMSRQHMVEAMSDEFLRLGGSVFTNSKVVGATEDGRLLLEDGRDVEVDLVIAADGIGSAIRSYMQLPHRRIELADGAMRVVIPRPLSDIESEGPDGPVPAIEYWSGQRRVIYNACAPDQVYVVLSCRADDRPGRQIPLHRESWQGAFPQLGELFDAISRHADWDYVFWQRFQVVKLESWFRGRVALVGDSAHGMPPNLGQGGGCAMMNALGLAVALEEEPDIESALSRWQRSERPLTEHTQRWSRVYSSAVSWPDTLRRGFFSSMGRFAWLRNQYNRTARHVPTGTA